MNNDQVKQKGGTLDMSYPQLNSAFTTQLNLSKPQQELTSTKSLYGKSSQVRKCHVL